MLRFLRYATEHGRKIRAVFLLEGQMVQKTVSVVSYDEENVTLRIGTAKNNGGSYHDSKDQSLAGKPSERI